jgi:hypothetical protein
MTVRAGGSELISREADRFILSRPYQPLSVLSYDVLTTLSIYCLISRSIRYGTKPRIVAVILDYSRSPRIFTNDEAFAALDPAAHNLPNISVEYIPNEDEDRPLPDL